VRDLGSIRRRRTRTCRSSGDGFVRKDDNLVDQLIEVRDGVEARELVLDLVLCAMVELGEVAHLFTLISLYSSTCYYCGTSLRMLCTSVASERTSIPSQSAVDYQQLLDQCEHTAKHSPTDCLTYPLYLCRLRPPHAAPLRLHYGGFVSNGLLLPNSAPRQARCPRERCAPLERVQYSPRIGNDPRLVFLCVTSRLLGFDGSVCKATSVSTQTTPTAPSPPLPRRSRFERLYRDRHFA
jgi:hypothetical protein